MHNPYERMYDAKMEVYRYIPGKDADGFDTNTESLVIEGAKCRYSISSQTTAENGVPVIVSPAKLFCGIEHDMKPGDKVVITLRKGDPITVKLGECHPYRFQWQCQVEKDDKA
ncbi:hypothetical protein [Lacrimispora sp.]|uniref:hypothetical protein n=1 Tax=Lacrimispora sp. TaxID=2719234 RepID=UPI00345F4684